MDRRRFIKNVVATSTAAYCSPALSLDVTPAASHLKMKETSHITTSIRANFGAGFQVEQAYQSSNLTYANISNRENHYLVSSSDQLQWQIVKSTSM